MDKPNDISDEKPKNEPEKELVDADATLDESIFSDETFSSTRHDFQLGRRFFHMGMGTFVVFTYGFFLDHQKAVYILGAAACLLYVMEQVRISYPQFANFFKKFSQYLLRAEEQLNESAAVPYVMAILLTLITFPKIVAIVSILTLAWADPLSALIGIKYGKRKIREGKSFAGSLAFFVASFLCCLIPLGIYSGNFAPRLWFFSMSVALVVTCFELIPLKVDDNLTIPLFTAVTVWSLGFLVGVQF